MTHEQLKEIYKHVHLLQALAVDEEEFFRYLATVPFNLLPRVIHGSFKEWLFMLENAQDLYKQTKGK